MDSDCTVKTHVNNLVSKMRKRTWALARLKKKGFSTAELVEVYKSLIRPMAEYLSPAWHVLATAEQSAQLERQQTHALTNIFGPGISAKRMKEESDLELLQCRREAAVKKVCHQMP